MSSIYIHIPFCQKACHYCNFYFTTSSKQKSKLVTFLIKEIELRKNELIDEKIETIYFGGGTPSLLTHLEFQQIINAISQHYQLSNQLELSLESNPENLTPEYLTELKSLGFNRISIGVQSFHNEDLMLMNRNHDSNQAKKAIEAACQIFKNVSIDLIFGLPYSGMERWKSNLELATQFDIKHISTYNLTLEEKTALANKVKRNELSLEPDTTLNDMYFYTIDFLESKNFIQYEISNFGQQDFFSKHNVNYWNQTRYLGFGPSAHSYNGIERRSNISNLNNYLTLIEKGQSYWAFETLSADNLYNEFVLTRLRTIFGVDIYEIKAKFGENYSTHFLNTIEEFINNQQIIEENGVYTLTKTGKVWADHISAELMN